MAALSAAAPTSVSFSSPPAAVMAALTAAAPTSVSPNTSAVHETALSAAVSTSLFSSLPPVSQHETRMRRMRIRREWRHIESELEKWFSGPEDEDMLQFASPAEKKAELSRRFRERGLSEERVEDAAARLLISRETPEAPLRRQNLPGSSSLPQTVPPPSADEDLPLFSFQTQGGSSSPMERQAIDVTARVIRGGGVRESPSSGSSLYRTSDEIARGWVERTIGSGSSCRVVVIEGNSRFKLDDDERELLAGDADAEPDEFVKLHRTHCVWRSAILPPTVQEECLACEKELGVC